VLLDRTVARPENPDPDEGPDVGTDDEALHWAGDEARGQAAPSLARAGGEPVKVGDEPTDVVVVTSNPVRLLGTGIFAGVFLAYTVGWILSVQAIPSPASDLFGEIMWQFGEFLAIIAAALWFASTTYLTRECTTRLRFGWFALGVLLLFPWPIVWGLIS
jgi:hypothetical protein